MVMLPVLFFFVVHEVRTTMAPPCVATGMNLDRAKWILFWELMPLYEKHTVLP